MKVLQGDIVYGPLGRPGVVINRNDITGELNVENQGSRYQAARKYGFINGLEQQERLKFREIIDKVRLLNNPRQRVQELTKQVEALEVDPRNQKLVRYLNAEKAHIMYSENISPREYKLDEAKIL